MADDTIRAGEFGEFARRMDERFDHVDRRFDSLEQRIDQRFDSIQAEMRSMRTMMLALHVPVVVAILGAVAKYLFFD